MLHLLITEFELLLVDLKETVLNFLIAPPQRLLDEFTNVSLFFAMLGEVGIDEGSNFGFRILGQLRPTVSIKYANCVGVY